MFQAYPMIFEVLFGVFVGLLVSFGYIKWHGKCQRSGKAWAQREVNRRLPIAILASPCSQHLPMLEPAVFDQYLPYSFRWLLGQCTTD
ncbi:major facilitator superfamily transporter [Penicillium hetheringtonii]|uniref:Major facilitator superfamily transporter n=1 Tax=Penicillium hetheringtonii TaxID=911720 RepID=A0AAD6DCK4_9EURO|nr:major facilitator superfamily transporter [Penicillium hetheringtonii]